MPQINTHLRGVGPTADFSNEKLYFCFCDFYKGNFIFSDDGSLCVFDFEQASFLPTSFMTFALIQSRPACFAIRDKLSLPQGNLPAMRLACGYFVMSVRRIGMYYLIGIWLSFINHWWLQVFLWSELINLLASKIKQTRGSQGRRVGEGGGTRSVTAKLALCCIARP